MHRLRGGDRAGSRPTPLEALPGASASAPACPSAPAPRDGCRAPRARECAAVATPRYRSRVPRAEKRPRAGASTGAPRERSPVPRTRERTSQRVPKRATRGRPGNSGSGKRSAAGSLRVRSRVSRAPERPKSPIQAQAQRLSGDPDVRRLRARGGAHPREASSGALPRAPARTRAPAPPQALGGRMAHRRTEETAVGNAAAPAREARAHRCLRARALKECAAGIASFSRPANPAPRRGGRVSRAKRSRPAVLLGVRWIWHRVEPNRGVGGLGYFVPDDREKFRVRVRWRSPGDTEPPRLAERWGSLAPFCWEKKIHGMSPHLVGVWSGPRGNLARALLKKKKWKRFQVLEESIPLAGVC